MAYRRTRVYIAGPYSKGDPQANTERAMDVWRDLWDAGYAPFCPHWSHFQEQRLPMPYGEWLEYDKEWLSCCDALLRLPCESSGAEKEWNVARRLGLPTFTNIEALRAAVAPQREV